MNKQNKTKLLTYNAILIAITVLVGAVPQLGFIQIPNMTAITVMHIPVIIAGILFGMFSSVITSLAFGVTSMLVAMSRGFGIDLMFMNPVVSVLPRFIFGIFVGLLYTFIKRFKMDDKLKIAITAFLSSIFHTAIVLTILFVVMGFSDVAEFLAANKAGFWLFIAPNLLVALGEAIAAVVITTPVVLALRRVIR